jgi:preprotein translocase subunit SecE
MRKLNERVASGTTMTKISPMEFARQVRTEAAKVTWPTRKETMITTGMVILMVLLAAAFFFIADQVLSLLVRTILGSGASS